MQSPHAAALEARAACARKRSHQKAAGFPQLSPTHYNQRKPACSSEDPAQTEVNKSNYFVKKKKKDSVSLAASLKCLKLNSHRISSSWSSPTALI